MSRGLLLAACLPAVLASCAPPGGNGAAATPGAAVFSARCAVCHGLDGTLGRSGAKDLSTGTLGREEVIAVIASGKGGMAGFARTLSAQQIHEVADHVMSLRKTETHAE